jgi:hypothetical protein
MIAMENFALSKGDKSLMAEVNSAGAPVIAPRRCSKARTDPTPGDEAAAAVKLCQNVIAQFYCEMTASSSYIEAVG